MPEHLSPTASVHLGLVRRDSCPACGSDACTRLYNDSYTSDRMVAYLRHFYDPQGGVELRYLEGAEFLVDRCNVCELVFQRDVPNGPLLGKLYDEWINPERARIATLAGQDTHYYLQIVRELVRIVAHFDQPSGALKMLDVGMGWCPWTFAARGFGSQVTGLELSNARIAFANANGIATIRWDELQPNSFDVINCDQVLEHVDDPRGALRDLAPTLRPGGLMRLTVPNGWDIERKLHVANWLAPKDHADSLEDIAPLEHLNCFSRHALLHLAKLVGLHPIELRSHEGLVSRLKHTSPVNVLRPLKAKAQALTRRPGATHVYLQRE